MADLSPTFAAFNARCRRRRIWAAIHQAISRAFVAVGIAACAWVGVEMIDALRSCGAC